MCDCKWDATPTHILSGRKCPVCSKKHSSDLRRTSQAEYEALLQSNHPNIKLIGEYITCHDKILHKCKTCGHEWEVCPSNITRILGCPKCSDGVSYPNKFICSLLDQIKVEYVIEKSFDWSNGKRYDIYIPSLNCIIENHGNQHYCENGFSTIGGRTLHEEERNDNIKMNLALLNKINNYIIIDCRKSEKTYIKESIMSSHLPELLKFAENDINWGACDNFATSSFITKTAELWEQGLSIDFISNKLKLHRGTVTRYLRTANSLKLCNYTRVEAYQRTKLQRNTKHHNSKQVIRLSDGVVYDTMQECADKNNMTRKMIYSRCKAHKDFMHYDEWLKQQHKLQEVDTYFKN